MKLYLNNDTLTIELEWYEQLWAFTLDRQIRIPLTRIDRVTTAEPEVPVPVPTAERVLIQVHTCGVCRTDFTYRRWGINPAQTAVNPRTSNCRYDRRSGEGCARCFPARNSRGRTLAGSYL